MKRIWAILIAIFALSHPVSGQQYPPYLVYTLVGGVLTAATGSGTTLPTQPPPFLCYGLDSNNQPAPCVFGGTGPGISLTTTGTSGAATLIGTVLNIPVYQAGLSLLKGTYADGDLCTYVTSGTLLNCNTAIPTGTVTSVDGSASEGAETAVSGTVAAITAAGIVRGAAPYISKTGGVTLSEANRGHLLISNDASDDVYVLPTPSGANFQNGWYVEVKNTSTTNKITLTPAGATTIDGVATVVIPIKTAIKFESDGTNYHTMMISPNSQNAANLVYASPDGATGSPYMRALVSGDIPSNAANTSGTAAKATNLVGGALGSAPYQNLADTTLFIAGPTTTGHTFVYAWQPSGAVIAPTAVDANTLAVSSAATAANLSGTPAVPNGTTATTQAAGDATTKLATDAFASNLSSFTWSVQPGTTTGTVEQILYASHAGTLTACLVGITTTDPSTSFVFDVKKGGTSILSGGAQTIAATTTGYVAYSLTSASISVAQYDAIVPSFTTIGAAWFVQITCH